MGTEKRVTNKLDTSQPGPGQYNSTILGTSAPKYSMRKKTENVSDPSKFVVSPGPGNYTPSYGNKAPSYSMRLRPNTSRGTENVPGPGQYSLRRDTDLNHPSYK